MMPAIAIPDQALLLVLSPDERARLTAYIEIELAAWEGDDDAELVARVLRKVLEVQST